MQMQIWNLQVTKTNLFSYTEEAFTCNSLRDCVRFIYQLMQGDILALTTHSFIESESQDFAQITRMVFLK